MPRTIEPTTKAIKNYLEKNKNTVFVIPEYQRAYSWNITNCDRLWQDIIDYSNNNNDKDDDDKDKYFFGTIIINCQDNNTKLDLIDGQQRTTSFLLLLKALLLRVNKAIKETPEDSDSKSLLRGLKERRRTIMKILYKVDAEEIEDTPDIDKDKDIYSKVNLIENKSINEQYKNEFNIILQAVEYNEAENKVFKFGKKLKDNKYTNFFKNFKHFYEKCKELSDTQINTISKTFVEQCEVIEIKSWNVEQAITMFNSLNSDGMPLYDSDIISAKLYAVAEKNGKSTEFTSKWKELLSIVNELNSMKIGNIDSILMQRMYYERAKNTDSQSIDVTVPGLRRYFTEINKDILNKPIELCDGIINLAQIWKKLAEYPTMQVLLKFNENAKLFLASYFYRFDNVNKIQEDSIKPLLESFLKLFTVYELVDTGYSSKYFKTFLFGEEVKLVDPKILLTEITNDFNQHINKSWDKEELKAAIMEYNKNTLVYLNEYLVAKENKISFNLSSSYDIEHIMPNSGNNIETIRADANIKDNDEFDNVVNKLGNKILLEQKINRSIGNEWFRTKVKKSGYKNSNYPMAKKLVERYENDSKPVWQKEDIMKATEEASLRIINFIYSK